MEKISQYYWEDMTPKRWFLPIQLRRLERYITWALGVIVILFQLDT